MAFIEIIEFITSIEDIRLINSIVGTFFTIVLTAFLVWSTISMNRYIKKKDKDEKKHGYILLELKHLRLLHFGCNPVKAFPKELRTWLLS